MLIKNVLDRGITKDELNELENERMYFQIQSPFGGYWFFEISRLYNCSDEYISNIRNMMNEKYPVKGYKWDTRYEGSLCYDLVLTKEVGHNMYKEVCRECYKLSKKCKHK